MDDYQRWESRGMGNYTGPVAKTNRLMVSVMSRRLPRNAPCPCGSGKKYKHCCIDKEFDWVELDDGRIAQQVPLSDEAIEILEGLRQSHIDRYGVEPEKVFEGAPPLELIEHWTVEAMKKAGVEPALIHAYEKTDGLLLNARNENKAPDTDIAAWEAAIDEYERMTGKKASRRRLTEEDIEGILQNCPQNRPQNDFVTRLPLSPPFTKEEWGKRQVADLFKDRECFDYFRQCLEQVTRSGRSERYLAMFCMMTQLGNPPDDDEEEVDYHALLADAMNQEFSVEQLQHSLESVVMTCQPKGAIPNAAAAFEFLGFIGDFVNSYAEEAGMADDLKDVLADVNSLALLAFVAAVNCDLGIQPDIWTT